MSREDQENAFEGVITSVKFKNEDNGYAVLEITDDDGGELTAVGILSLFEEGERVRVHGVYTEHPTYGIQMKVDNCETVMPSDLVGIERYLASGLVKGVGPATAHLIVRHFGKESLDVMNYAPHRLEEIPGIGAVKSAKIAESFRQQQEMRNTMVFLQGHGVTPLLSVKIYKQYGDATKLLVTENPYRLAEEIDGIGFVIADRIGRQLGKEKDDEQRIRAGILYTMNRATEFGHVCLPREILVQEAQKLLDADSAPIERMVEELEIGQYLIPQTVGGDTWLYEASMLENERYTAERLLQIAGQGEDETDDPEGWIRGAEEALGIELAEEQHQAVLSALRSPLCVITGGPGTGKTTILRVVLEILEAQGIQVLLAAPTGRAARRMQDATGREAKTVHRMLEYMSDDNGPGYFNRNQEYPLDADVIIIDECSMVDLFLMNRLLRAVPRGARLVLVGDQDQLPSVGPGNVLRDIIGSGAADCVMLHEIFRQARESLIVTNAHRINEGRYPKLHVRDRDFFFERQATAQKAAQSVVELCRRRLPAFTGQDVFTGIQVLAPMRKGEAGVNSLNEMLQEAINPPEAGKPQIQVGRTVFRNGDKVMQTKNNYRIKWRRGDEEGEGVFNGESGMIRMIDEEEKSLLVELDDGRFVEYAFEDLDEVSIAYAISVHKSQGSEYDVVVMPVLGGAPMLMTRNLLYTALTRAKKMVVLVGSEQSICRMVDNDRIAQRYGCLLQRLRGDV